MAEKAQNFNSAKVPRGQWMKPSWIASNRRFVMNSQLFAVRTPFNSAECEYEVPYKVHPWVKSACVPNNSTWIPNPYRVRFYDGVSGTLEELDDSSLHQLEPGDVVKITFKMVFTVGRQYWQPSIRPLQVTRVGQVSTTMANPMFEDEPIGIELPKSGFRVEVIKRKVMFCLELRTGFLIQPFFVRCQVLNLVGRNTTVLFLGGALRGI